MSDEIIEGQATEAEVTAEAKKEFSIEVRISDCNLQYRSDFNEAETIFWLEAVKDLILKNAFQNTQLTDS